MGFIHGSDAEEDRKRPTPIRSKRGHQTSCSGTYSFDELDEQERATLCRATS